MTPTTTTPTTTPVFDPRQPDEGWSAYSRRALMFILKTGDHATWRLDDEALEACADGARVASTGRALPADVAEHLARLQRRLRGLVQARATDRATRLAALQALADDGQGGMATPAPTPVLRQPDAPSGQSGNGSGGAKVPRTPQPKPQPPAAGRQPLSPPLPVLQPVPALVGDDLF
jgi:hypothetical protein